MLIICIYNKLRATIYRISAKFLFGNVGRYSYIIHPMRIRGGIFVKLGENVSILNNLRLEVVAGQDNNTSVNIGDNTSIEQNVHITCGESITIGRNCSISGDVTITDIINRYYNIDIPLSQQGIDTNPVIIDDDVYIGMGARILSGVKIGKHSVIGANAVVIHDVPDYCVACGVPARIIKKYDFKLNDWIRV